MGFWKKKAEPEAEVVVVPTSGFLYNNRGLTPVMEARIKEMLSHDDLFYSELVAKYRDETIKISTDLIVATLNKSDKETLATVKRYFDYLSQGFIRFNRRYLWNSQIDYMYETIYTTLPTTIHQLRTDAFDEKENYGNLYITEMYDPIIDELKTIVAKLNQEYKKHIKYVDEKKLMESANYGALELQTQPELKLPAFNTENEELTEAFQSISTLWLKAMTHNNTVENEFFLERTATTYLPDVLSVYSSFKNASEQERNDASKMLLEYFSTLERKLYSILGMVMQQSLAYLKVEVDFMQAKVGPEESSSELRLQK